VEGSGSAAAASGEAAIGLAAAAGSKTDVAPGPTVKLIPLGKAAELVEYSVPATSVRTSRHRYRAAVKSNQERRGAGFLQPPDLLSPARLSTGQGAVIVPEPGKTTELAAWAGAARGRDGLPAAMRSYWGRDVWSPLSRTREA